MANMSYVRFQNTESDLSDCITALDELVTDLEEGVMDPLSREERSAADRMVRLCHEYLNRHAEMVLALEDLGRE